MTSSRLTAGFLIPRHLPPPADVTSGIVFFGMLSQQVRTRAKHTNSWPARPGWLRAVGRGSGHPARCFYHACAWHAWLPGHPRPRAPQTPVTPDPRLLNASVCWDAAAACAGAPASDPVPHVWPHLHGPVRHLQGLPHHLDHWCAGFACLCCKLLIERVRWAECPIASSVFLIILITGALESCLH